MKIKFALILITLVLLALACSLSGTASQVTQTPLLSDAEDEPTEKPLPIETEKRCGDGTCNGPENKENCPQDCDRESESHLDIEDTPGEEYRVINPTSGAELYVHVTTPDIANAVLFPAVVLVPGGIDDSAGFRRPGAMADKLAEAGYVTVVFDPDGRGNSEGEENYNGHAQQDGLAKVIQFAADLAQVDSDRLGLVSYSYGVTMASGALARHQDLPILFYIDWEGPADRFDTTTNCTPNTRIDFSPCNDDAFWSQREALKFISEVQVPYQRLQTEDDHVQSDVDHAINMITAAAQGNSPWVRLNNLQPNELYHNENPPEMIPESDPRSLEQLTLDYLDELFNIHHQP
jgi:pimeloyl-ACP methyl ester carboxylesterase